MDYNGTSGNDVKLPEQQRHETPPIRKLSLVTAQTPANF